jgi:hypothetical protein
MHVCITERQVHVRGKPTLQGEGNLKAGTSLFAHLHQSEDVQKN